MMENSEMIGVDVGNVRSGLARASSMAKIAEPLQSVLTKHLLEELKGLIRARPVSAVVFGLPQNLSGGDSAQTRTVRQLVESIKEQLAAPLYWQDEALSTKLAVSRKSDKLKDDHAEAAAIILQDFINTPLEQRQAC